MMQLLPVLCIPFVAVIQSYRYLNNGPSDILEVCKTFQLTYFKTISHCVLLSIAA